MLLREKSGNQEGFKDDTRNIVAREVREVWNYALLIILIAIALTGCGQEQGTQEQGGPVEQSKNIMSRQWHAMFHLDIINATYVTSQDTATNETGDTIAVWIQAESGGLRNVWSSYYDSDKKAWSAPDIVENNDVGSAMGASVAMDSAGNAVVTWFQFVGGKYNIYASMFDKSEGAWGSAIDIDWVDGGHAFKPVVSMDDFGNAVVVWYQRDGSRYSILSNRYDFAAGAWGEAEFLESSDSGDAYTPYIDGTASGKVMAVWKQFDGESYNVWSSSYEPGSGWGVPILLEDENLGGAYNPVIALNDKGDAVAAWIQYDGTKDSVYANRYVMESGQWSGASLLEQGDGGSSYEPKVDMDNNGNAIVAWGQYDGSRCVIFASRFDAEADAWQGEIKLDEGQAADSDYPDVAMDSEGNAVVVWQHYGGNSTVKVRRYDISTSTWGEVEDVCNGVEGEMGTNVNAYSPHVVFDGSGRAILSWRVIMDGVHGLCINILS